ncbi:hypothetical protein BT96DRAFT_993674 [Gymnopus androsaceus JB14]|uniref:Uncharacterized protein n=1 Tax=Gymnopus androsaceus JB14 TaxID=1447944 RepID=A0A6A4HRZ8_9AGAR|nr:hypothetical protein BT96DRAFT_993674 [Gymnopus androsaceus JB14]
MFAGSHSIPTNSLLISKPRKLEEDGMPLGRSHHAERAMKHHENHTLVEPPISHTPSFPIHAPATSPPSIPTHRKQVSSLPLGRLNTPRTCAAGSDGGGRD